jgi:heme a synthase
MRRISPARYQRLTLLALVFLAIIIFTGAAVRLTGSGLGCNDWPNCEPGRLVAASNSHQAIEQINRLFTGLMAVSIMGALAGSLLRLPRRKDLTRLSLSLVGGFFLQAVVGGIVVKTKLHPLAVMWHFLLSAIVLVAALVLHQRASETVSNGYRLTVRPNVRRLVVAAACLGTLAVISGTVVTGTGPHSGAYKDEPVRRFSFALISVARVHSFLVLALLAVLLVLFRTIRRTPDWTVCEDRLGVVLFAVFAQGGIGYFQYFTKLPAGLVAAHVAGATAVVITLTRLLLVTRTPEVGAVADEHPASVALSQG